MLKLTKLIYTFKTLSRLQKLQGTAMSPVDGVSNSFDDGGVVPTLFIAIIKNRLELASTARIAQKVVTF